MIAVEDMEDDAVDDKQIELRDLDEMETEI